MNAIVPQVMYEIFRAIEIELPHMCQGIILEGESGYYGIVVVVI